MSDVTALVDKLKSSISYKQFDAPRASDSYAWPVLEKMARAQSAATSPDFAPPSSFEVTAPVSTTPKASTSGSLFDRLQARDNVPQARGAQADRGASQGAGFSRYATAKAVEGSTRVLSEIFARIEQKAR